MIGVVSQGPVYHDLFEEFAYLATQGMCPLGAPHERGHKDGWGLVCFQNGALNGSARLRDLAHHAYRPLPLLSTEADAFESPRYWTL